MQINPVEGQLFLTVPPQDLFVLSYLTVLSSAFILNFKKSLIKSIDPSQNIIPQFNHLPSEFAGQIHRLTQNL